MALPTVPEWLSKRDGFLKPGIWGHIVFVVVGGQPQYKLEARPAVGKFTCYVSETVNYKRLDDGTTYPTQEASFAGGLDQLRAKLGW